MPLALYDTWSRTVRSFTPIHAGHVGMYCCGPTVYDHAHIGNLRTYVFEDILRRVPRVFSALQQARDSVKAAANGFRRQLRIALSDDMTPSRLPALLAPCR